MSDCPSSFSLSLSLNGPERWPLYRLMPGKEFRATITPAGNVPIYKVRCVLTW
jgi:hypothetical protein